MEVGDKSIGVGGETTSRVSAGSPSWLCASRQRFTIELRPGETTIVSWKRLVKDAQSTSPPLTARKTEDSLDECFQDDKSTIKHNGLLVNSEKLECINEPVLSVAQQSRKRSKNMAKAQGEKVDDHVPYKHVKVEQGRLNFAAANALLEEQSSALLQNLAANGERDQKLHNLLSSPVRSYIEKPANIGTKSEHSSYAEISNNDASISPINSKDAHKYRSVTIHSRDIGNNTNSVATHQKYLEKTSCKQLESPVRKLMTDNDEEGISTKLEQRATCGELPDLNLPVYPVQPEAAALSIAPSVIPNFSPSKNFSQLVSSSPRLGCSIASPRRGLSIKATATTYDTSIVDYSSMLSVFPAEACETLGGDACRADIYPEVKLQPDARNDSPRTATELIDREYLEYNDAKTVFCAEACDDLGGEFCSREYQRGVY